jgi:hypothetical protein
MKAWFQSGKAWALCYGRVLATGLAVVAALYLLSTYWPMVMKSTMINYPYEDWDEIASFNSSRVLSSPESHRCYRYGSLDVARYIAGSAYYHYFDPVGKTGHVYTYSNNRPESLDDPYFAKREGAAKPRTVGPDFSYYRGVTEREPIFYARKFYAATVFVAHALAVGLLLFYWRSQSAVLVLLPLAVYSNIYFFGEAALARGNAFNSICAATIFYLLAAWLIQRKTSALYLACTTVALGVAHKFDFLAYGLPVAIAGIGGALQEPLRWRALLRIAAFCFLAFLVPLLVFWPFLAIEPWAELKPQLDTLKSIGGGTRDWATRVGDFAVFSANAFRMSDQVWSPLMRNVVPFAVMGTIPLLFFTLTQLRLSTRFLLALIAFCAPLHWAYIHANSWSIVPRYLLTGLLLNVAALAVVLQFWFTGNRWWQRILASLVVIAVFLGALKLHGDRKFMTMIVENSLRDGRGLWFGNSRNKAVLAAVDLAKTDGFSPVVLVDQHSYTDIRYLRAQGLDPQLVHALALEERMAKLDRSKSHVIIFAPLEPVPSGYWATVAHEDPTMTAAYRKYTEKIRQWQLAKEFGTNQAQFLEYGQIDNDQKVEVRIIPPSQESK